VSETSQSSMAERLPVYVSGWKTPDDWKITKAILTGNPKTGDWERAFDEFFRTRLDLRYLGPIRVLQDNGSFQGEGFSIAGIQCSLIEFLESTVQGINYRYVRREKDLGSYEYSSSSKIFMSFLMIREPFAKVFTKTIADDFYIGVRCGLLHEARTKNGWRIWARDSDERIIDPAKKILFRDNFQTALNLFIRDNGIELPRNTEYQAAFIRKFDNLVNE